MGVSVVYFRHCMRYWFFFMASSGPFLVAFQEGSTAAGLNAAEADPVLAHQSGGRLVYPETLRSEQQDDYHGVLVQDP
jgi:hypothetical protein